MGDELIANGSSRDGDLMPAQSVVDELWTYLDTSGAQRPARLPEWEDVQELAKEYGVTL
ncbi:hypothetical protein [Haloferax volcanii]|uniref:hypothetical protein n=1 Tax=Haloferax volcanii TaxID=2246 RepID=UPI001475B02F|nr:MULTISPECIES: hypothetical protein [Haloferax]